MFSFYLFPPRVVFPYQSYFLLTCEKLSIVDLPKGRSVS